MKCLGLCVQHPKMLWGLICTVPPCQRQVEKAAWSSIKYVHKHCCAPPNSTHTHPVRANAPTESEVRNTHPAPPLLPAWGAHTALGGSRGTHSKQHSYPPCSHGPGARRSPGHSWGRGEHGHKRCRQGEGTAHRPRGGSTDRGGPQGWRGPRGDPQDWGIPAAAPGEAQGPQLPVRACALHRPGTYFTGSSGRGAPAK